MIFGSKWWKNCEVKKIDRNFFWSESIKNVSKQIIYWLYNMKTYVYTENLKIEKFSFGLSFFGKNGQNSEKRTRSKKFGRTFFWSELIQNISKRIWNWKTRNRKFFPLQNFFLDLVFFYQNCVKMTKLKKFGRKFLTGIDSDCFKTYFKLKISKSKNTSGVKIFPGTLIFWSKWQIL